MGPEIASKKEEKKNKGIIKAAALLKTLKEGNTYKM